MLENNDLEFLDHFNDPAQIVHEGSSVRSLGYTPIIHQPLLVEIGLMESVQGYWISNHSHEDATEILFILHGTGSVIIENKCYPVKPGSLVIYHPMQPHYEDFTATTEKIAVYHLRIRSFQIHNLKMNQMLPENAEQVSTVNFNNTLIPSCFHVLFEESKHQELGYEQIVYKRLEILMLQILRLYPQYFPSNSENKKSLAQIAIHTKSYLDVHYQQHQDIHLENLAAALSVSKYYLSHCFTTYYGLPPMQYLKMRRIDEAKKLLFASSCPIKEIASCIGYENATNFTLHFRTQTGVSPTQYRTMSKAYKELDSGWATHTLEHSEKIL